MKRDRETATLPKYETRKAKRGAENEGKKKK
jgi:hypothetical protein